MSIKHIVTKGFGTGSFLGTIKDVVLRGFTSSPLRYRMTIDGITVNGLLGAQSSADPLITGQSKYADLLGASAEFN